MQYIKKGYILFGSFTGNRYISRLDNHNKIGETLEKIGTGKICDVTITHPPTVFFDSPQEAIRFRNQCIEWEENTLSRLTDDYSKKICMAHIQELKELEVKEIEISLDIHDVVLKED